jgi:CRISPR-associated endonuclease/helicase Cas3
MLFSCLIDADRCDTENYYLGLEGKRADRADWPQVHELRSVLDAHLHQLQTRAALTPVNSLRAEILTHARAASANHPGHFSMTVPTGGGKTLASLAFALDHAVTHGFDRIIYVIPFTNIIEQTAGVFRTALGRHHACVLEHHSAFDDDKLLAEARKRGAPEQGPQGRDKLRLAAENWDAPIVVTTAVQFFESLFANSPTRCRKLHNIACSVVILDEAQSFPLALLRPCVAMLDELVTNYRASIVLCTATQPALEETDIPDRSFKGGLRNVREIAPEPRRLYDALRRVTIGDLGVIEDVQLVERLAGHAQALCIVHTRAHARELYLALKHHPGTAHLSALMCPEHRSQRLADIKQRLKDGEPCRLIATSLIEAGVDVDFPVVYRASAGLDQIAQAAGRCNREGLRSAETSHVYVFESANRKLPKSMEVAVSAGRETMRKHASDPLSLCAVEDYFRLVYWGQSAGQVDGLDKHGILPRLQDRSKDLLFPFEDIARDFRLITDQSRPILIPFGKVGERLIAELGSAEEVGAIARKLQRYVVQVPRPAFAALEAVGAIQAVNPNRFGDQFWWLENAGLYHDEFGLDWSDPTFRQAEKLIL